MIINTRAKRIVNCKRIIEFARTAMSIREIAAAAGVSHVAIRWWLSGRYAHPKMEPCFHSIRDAYVQKFRQLGEHDIVDALIEYFPKPLIGELLQPQNRPFVKKTKEKKAFVPRRKLRIPALAHAKKMPRDRLSERS